MDDKETLINELLPKAALKALTPEALEAVPASQLAGDAIIIRGFPFRVGRESRVRKVDGRIERIERPKGKDGHPNNDLYLVDRGELLNISREHFQIERGAEGYILVDRGSACGTRVGEERLGSGDVGGQCVLRDGDVIAAGARGTPFLYRFYSFDDYELRRRD
jgi:pSer/pThr/pTyr-binding forkhead associated (FHA) protein